jgi:biotin carboxyl carrier protein
VKYYVKVNGRDHEVELVERLGKLLVSVDGKELDVTYEEVDDLGQVVMLRGGKSYGLSIEGDEARVQVTLAGHFHDITLEDERERAAHAADRAQDKGGGVVTAVMPGVVVELLVTKGAAVVKGQPLLILSAMKMQNEIGAPADGVVQDVYVAAGQAVSSGAKLLLLAAPPASA